jgi:hypothetical protein
MLGSELAVPALKRRRILGEVVKPVKQENFRPASAKLKRYLRLATTPCFISTQFVPEVAATFVLNSKYGSGFTA